MQSPLRGIRFEVCFDPLRTVRLAAMLSLMGGSIIKWIDRQWDRHPNAVNGLGLFR